MAEPTVRQHKKRSVTLLKDLKAIKEGEKTIEFNNLGQHTGEFRNSFSSFIGLTTRSKVKITRSWVKVTQSERDIIWAEIKRFWNIKEDTHKKEVLKFCANQFRDFKKRLNRDYVRTGQNPVEVYPYLDIETWEQFVEHCQSEIFQGISQKGRENSLKNTNPPRLGPSGYRGKRDKWRTEASAAEFKTDIDNIKDLRAQDFLYARMVPDPDDSTKRILPNELQPIKDKIIEADSQISQGIWTLGPEIDPLIYAVGSEHCGRTRAGGYTTGLRKGLPSIFEKRKRPREKSVHSVCDEEMKARCMEMESEHREKMAELEKREEEREARYREKDALFEARMKRLEEMEANYLKEKTSTSLFAAFREIKVPTPCSLLVPYGPRVVCAEGHVYPIENDVVVHSLPLLKGYVKVSVLRVSTKHQHCPLPQPAGEMSTLRDAHKSFVQWPCDKVELPKVLERAPQPTTNVPSIDLDVTSQYCCKGE